jgi:hypothetical protein
LHDEIQNWIGVYGNLKRAVDMFNVHLREVTTSSRDNAEWVQVCKDPRLDNNDVRFAMMGLTNLVDKEWQGPLCKLIAILPRFEDEPFPIHILPDNVVALTCNQIQPSSLSGVLLSTLWAENLVNNNSIISQQSIVEISTVGSQSKTELLCVPSRCLRRLRAGLSPNRAELEYFKSLSPSKLFSASAFTQHENMMQLLSHTISARSAFIATPGFVLLSADYSQIELRILAHLCQDTALIAACSSENDVFRFLASCWLCIHYDTVSESQRDTTKKLCYAIVYGAGVRCIAESLSMTEDTARETLRDFLSRFPGIQRFVQRAQYDCFTRGYAETMFGRKRKIVGIRSDNNKEKARAQRQAINSVCQGSAADLIKVSGL